MATPRKHWWRVADSVAYEPWSNDVVAAFVRLGGYLNTRWARQGLSAEKAGRALLSLPDLMQITGKQSLPAAVDALARLAEATGLEFQLRGAIPLVYFAQRPDGLIKIGKTTNWPRRAAQIAQEHGPVELLGVLENVDCGRLEKQIHREAAADRVTGEWFKRGPASDPWVARGLSATQAVLDPGTYRGRPTAQISWPKWPEFQGLHARESPQKRPRRTPETPPPQTQTQETPCSPPAVAGPPSLVARVRAVWPELVAAAARHGKRWQKLSGPRERLLAARLRELGDERALVQAIDGAVAYWRRTSPDRDMTAHLIPETVYRVSNTTKYIEAAQQPPARAAPARAVPPAQPAQPRASAAERAEGVRRLEEAFGPTWGRLAESKQMKPTGGEAS